MKIIQILALIVLILLTTPVTIAQTYGGSATISDATWLYGVCGEETKGWLITVGRKTVQRDVTQGVIYNITKIDGSTGWSVSIDPSDVRPPGKQYKNLTLYACGIIQDTTRNRYLLWLTGAVAQGDGTNPRGVILVYSIPESGGSPSRLGFTTFTTADAMFIDFIVVRDRTDQSKYHVYILSIEGTNTVLRSVTVTVADSASFGSLGQIFSESGSGYGISYNPWLNTLGVLRLSGGNLILSVYGNVDTGSPTLLGHVTVVPWFTGTRAAEAAYSGGYIVAAGGKIYKVTGTTSSMVLDGAFTGDAYALVVSESDNRKGAYVYSLQGNQIYISAIDLVNPGVGYRENFATGAMSGYGNAFIVYADPDTKAVKPAGTGNPYMVYTAGNAIIYYDLTRGRTAPYPIPEPNILLAIAVIAIASIVLFKIASKIIY